MDACVVDLTAAARSVQLLKINGFTATKESPSLPSRACSVGGHSWRIQFFPKSTSMNSKHYPPIVRDDWIMFRASLISKATLSVPASFSCCLVDPATLQPDPSTEIIASSMFSQNAFVDIDLTSRSDLRSSKKYLKDACLIVQCAITVLLGDPTDFSPAADADAGASPGVLPSSDLHEQFGELLRSQKGADITFLVSGETVAAHRSVLAARSPVFMAELFGDMKENALPSVEVEDIEVEVFKAMLYFIYTDTLPELEELKGEQATAMAQHLLVAADRYGLKRLKTICVQKVCTAIDVDNVATTLALADQHGCSKLKARCMTFTLENLAAVCATEGYRHLEASCPSVLTELLKLVVQWHK